MTTKNCGSYEVGIFVFGVENFAVFFVCWIAGRVRRIGIQGGDGVFGTSFRLKGAVLGGGEAKTEEEEEEEKCGWMGQVWNNIHSCEIYQQSDLGRYRLNQLGRPGAKGGSVVDWIGLGVSGRSGAKADWL